MKAEELRIGNYVSCMYYDDNNNEIWEDTTILCIDGTGGDIAEYKFWFEGSSNEEIYHETKLIQLTEEWILRFGFNLNGHRLFERLSLTKNGFTIEFEISGDICNCYLEMIGIEIQYVHQLQNLYFALTGEELILKQ